MATRCRARSIWANISPRSGPPKSTTTGEADVMWLRLFPAAAICLVMSATTHVSAQQKYDLLLKGGHVVDARNNISAVRDVAIADGKVAARAPEHKAGDALRRVEEVRPYGPPG